MDKLTPTQKDVVTALQAGAATITELGERTGRSPRALSKAVADLASAGHLAERRRRARTPVGARRPHGRGGGGGGGGRGYGAARR
jgi:predicted transcriptional regulator